MRTTDRNRIDRVAHRDARCRQTRLGLFQQLPCELDGLARGRIAEGGLAVRRFRRHTDHMEQPDRPGRSGRRSQRFELILRRVTQTLKGGNRRPGGAPEPGAENGVGNVLLEK